VVIGSLRRAIVGGAAAAVLAAPTAAADAVEPPMVLPGEAGAASPSAPAARGTWIVGARPGAAARAVASRYDARHIGPAGTGGYVLARNRARAFAAALERRGLLVYAQPDTLAEPHVAVPPDPLSGPPDNWRDWVADPALAPPAVGPASPLIALVDAQLDLAHGEWQGGNTTALRQFAVTNSHGTATTSVAAAPDNGVGIVGVWPRARALNVPLPEDIPCSRSAERIRTAIEHDAAVINMSYGSTEPCFPEYVALQFAVAHGIVPVAAAGNEFAARNPLEYPASLPHVLTVAAVGPPPGFRSSYFSNANAAIDLSAPGESIMTAVPVALDTDGVADGYQRQSGTSFAAPMVSAAVAWVRAARPDLTADQVNQAVRLSARDLGRDGYDDDTGFGLLDVGAALTREPPPPDPLEPNDDVTWVDGRSFGSPAPPVFRGRRLVRLKGIVDAYEDPVDVYRVRISPRSRVRVTARPAFGNPVLAGFAPGTRTVRREPLALSQRRGGRTERITLRNRSRRARTFFVGLAVQRGRVVDAGYRLTIRRG
jgi:hypothetical protein